MPRSWETDYWGDVRVHAIWALVILLLAFGFGYLVWSENVLLPRTMAEKGYCWTELRPAKLSQESALAQSAIWGYAPCPGSKPAEK